MKNSPPEILRDRIAKFRQFLAEYDGLEVKKNDAENRLSELSVNGDLEDGAVLTQIAQLQVFVQLFPSRIQARANIFGATANNFNDDCSVFISQLNARGDDLLSKVRAKSAASLKEHFKDESALAAAVEKTALMNEANQILAAIRYSKSSIVTAMNMNSERLMERAEGLLAIWQQADAFEAEQIQS